MRTVGHHVVYRQELRKVAQRRPPAGAPYEVGLEMRLVADERNIVRCAFPCHTAHHSGKVPFKLWMFPDSVFEFAEEVLGAPAAYEYLRRRYRGEDPRLDALIAGESNEEREI